MRIFSLLCGVMTVGQAIAGQQQLLVVTTNDWDATQGKLTLFERTSDESTWTQVHAPIPVVVGKTGLAWGIGLHPATLDAPQKREGDKKSPAGMFSLGTAFGFATRAEMESLKIDYLPINAAIEAVDDPKSRYYNCIVDNREVVCDWQSSEKMGEEPLYALGLMINHNFPSPQPGGGSAIFMHIWDGENSDTVGCTAMGVDHLRTVISWLDRDKHPLLVQLPIHEYKQRQSTWNLPPLPLPEASNLVDISEAIPEILLDLRYATSDNFLGLPVYAKPICYLHQQTAEALRQVQQELTSMGLGLKIFDGYRPLSVQQVMWDVIQDERYVANPAKHKGVHTRGIAVDLTLVDSDGHELEMPTAFDDFSERAHCDYADLPEAAVRNRALLSEVMQKHGFEPAPTEWWHFNLKGWKDDVRYPPLDIPL